MTDEAFTYELIGTAILLVPFVLFFVYLYRVGNRTNTRQVLSETNKQDEDEYKTCLMLEAQDRMSMYNRLSQLESLARNGDLVAYEEWKELRDFLED